MAPNIPGFYYDAEKKKYFKIVAKHNAPPAAKKYTREAINQQAEIARKRQADDAINRWRSSWMPVRKIVSSPRTSYLMQREINHGWSPSKNLSIWMHDATKAEQKLSAISSAGSTLLGFQRESQRLVVGHNPSAYEYNSSEDGSTLSVYSYSKDPDGSLDGDNYCSGLVHRRWLSKRITCMSLCAQATDQALVAGVNWIDVYSHDLSSDNIFDRTENSMPLPFKACATQSHGTEKMAFIRGSSPLYFDDHTRHYGFLRWPRIPEDISRSDFLSICWQDMNVAIWGTRDGSILLHDTRSQSDQFIVKRLTQKSPVISIHSLDPTRIITAGLGKDLQMFDLRFVHSLPGQGEVSEPYVHYSEYLNPANLQVPVAVSDELGAIATGSSKGMVRIFDIWTGREISHVRKQGTVFRGFREVNEAGPITSLCFSLPSQSESRDTLGPSLFVGRPSVVESWTW